MRTISKLIAAFLLLFVFLQSASAAGPSFSVVSPKDGEAVNGTSVTVDLQLSDFKLVPSTVPLSEAGKHPELNKPGEGHYHLVLDLRPLVILDHEGPYTYTNVPPGDHQLMVELVNIDHSSFAPPIMQQIKFSTIAGEALPQTGAEVTPTFGLWFALLVASLLIVTTGWLVVRRNRSGVVD